MYQTILVPLDGSKLCEQALPLAAGIAGRAGAKLHVAHVHDVGSDHLLTFYTLDPRTKEAENRYLEGIVKRLRGETGVSVDSALIMGPVAEALGEYAQVVGADLVVMTTHGRGALSRFWLGSVADQLVRQMSIPLHLVRPVDVGAEPRLLASFQRILIPLDGSTLGEQILEPALALGSLTAAEYLLVQVVKPLSIIGSPLGGYAAVADDPSLVAALQRNAQEYLDRVAGRLLARACSVQTRVLVHPQASVAILEEAAAQGSQIIALATHGRGGLKRLLLGSVADKVVRESLVPVLVQRPRV
jgi:nucleotide-binding universal stress UspA family protein